MTSSPTLASRLLLKIKSECFSLTCTSPISSAQYWEGQIQDIPIVTESSTGWCCHPKERNSPSTFLWDSNYSGSPCGLKRVQAHTAHSPSLFQLLAESWRLPGAMMTCRTGPNCPTAVEVPLLAIASPSRCQGLPPSSLGGLKPDASLCRVRDPFGTNTL